MSTAGSATRPPRCSRSGWPRSSAASARSPPPAARPRCTWRSRRWPAPAATSSSSSALYGGSHNLLHYTLARFGIATTFVRPGDIDGWRAAIRPETRLLFGETLGNPGLDVLDIPTVAAIAHDHGLPLLVDSTLTTPWLIRPFEHGADLVYHSATKFLSGHGTVVGGVLVDSGQFDWDRSGPLPRTDHSRMPAFTTWSSARKAAPRPSCCARAARGCAISAPASARTPPG